MSIVCHITAESDWNPDADEYRHPTLDGQGFVHCSDPEQAVPVAEANHAAETDLVLLCIDTDAVDAPVKYEALGEATEPYPHVYGPVPTDAVVEVVPFPWTDDGFELPERVVTLAREYEEGRGGTV